MEIKKQDKKLALTLPVQVETLTEKDMSVVMGGGGTNLSGVQKSTNKTSSKANVPLT